MATPWRRPRASQAGVEMIDRYRQLEAQARIVLDVLADVYVTQLAAEHRMLLVASGIDALELAAPDRQIRRG